MTAYDHTDVAPYLRAYATSVSELDEDGLPKRGASRLVQWAYYRQGDVVNPVGIIRPKGAGQGFEVQLLDPADVTLDGDFWTRRTAERALRFAAAGLPVPQ